MQRAGAILVVLILGAVLYRAWQNTQADASIELQARTVACQELGTCSSAEESYLSAARNPFRHVYTFKTSQGMAEVTCRWSMVMVGTTKCSGVLETETAVDPHAPDRYPHQVNRGTP